MNKVKSTFKAAFQTPNCLAKTQTFQILRIAHMHFESTSRIITLIRSPLQAEGILKDNAQLWTKWRRKIDSDVLSHSRG